MKRELQMAVVATSGMTFFSYILSRIFKEKFLETTLLNQLMFPLQNEDKKHHVAGVGVHYSVGYFFSVIYNWLWNRTSLPAGIATGSILGFINGLAGIIGWNMVFRIHPNPPVIRPVKYYLQLLAAHVVFGSLNGIVYKLKTSAGSGTCRVICLKRNQE